MKELSKKEQCTRCLKCRWNRVFENDETVYCVNPNLLGKNYPYAIKDTAECYEFMVE